MCSHEIWYNEALFSRCLAFLVARMVSAAEAWASHILSASGKQPNPPSVLAMCSRGHQGTPCLSGLEVSWADWITTFKRHRLSSFSILVIQRRVTGTYMPVQSGCEAKSCRTPGRLRQVWPAATSTSQPDTLSQQKSAPNKELRRHKHHACSDMCNEAAWVKSGQSNGILCSSKALQVL
eukprot:1160508-Pelagomonas_calceolata.AAC.9